MPSASAKTRQVFLSYARKDGAGLAHLLRDFLAQANFEPWLDTQRIDGGASWSREIEDAIDGSDALIAILTEGSYVSEICRAEQMRALRIGKTVIPVLARASTPRPLFLETLNYREFPAQKNELVSDLGGKSKPVVLPQLRYDTVPSLPQKFMARQRAVADLRDLLFSSDGSSESIAVTAVAGMGGIGKTVLTIALCRDATVRDAFPDGIAWITIGREWDGDFVPRMREVAKALGEDLAAWDNPLACQTQYRNLLRDKAALVVIDDVWNIQHLEQLLVEAPRSRFLFTTRNKTIVRAKTDRYYAADVLSSDEARDLLALCAHVKIERLPPAESAAIIEDCGGLALALAQIGGSLRGLPAYEWSYTVDHLKNADVSALQAQLPTGQDNFFKSLAVSLDAIRDETLRERYRTLAVLLEDVPAPLTVLRTLWAASESEARQTARYFVDRSLATWESDGDPAQGIKLHDLQLDYVRAGYPNQESLQLIHEATRLSSHVLQNNPEQYSSQLTGRLCGLKSNTEIAQFVTQISAAAPKPWLQSRYPALHPPGTPLVRTLEGHADSVWGVAVTEDGRRAVSASHDSTLKVWDLESGRAFLTLEGHSDFVNSVAVTGDGRRAVSASDDTTLKVWDLERGRALHTLKGHASFVTGVAVTMDGRRAVSASKDKMLKVWDLESGRAIHTLEGHSSTVTGVAVTGDGRRAVSASNDHTLKVWDLESGLALRTLEGHTASVLGVAVTGDGRRAVSASWEATLKVWDLESGRALYTLEGHSDRVNGVAVTEDGRRAVSASTDNTLKVWDLESGRGTLFTLQGHSSYVFDVAVMEGGRRAVSASADKTLKVWDLETGQGIATFTCDIPLYCCAAAGALIVAGDLAGRVYFLRFVE